MAGLTTVVTGAAGFVGNNLVRALLAAGHRVRAMVFDRAEPLDGLDVEIVSGDVTRPDTLARAFEGAELVFHTVAIISLLGDPDGQVHAVNVDGARNAARAALEAGVRRYVHTSSCHAFDLDEPISERSARPGPKLPAYDRSKAAGEAEVRAVIADGLDAVILNPAGIVGPRDFRPSPMGGALVDLATGKVPALIQGGFHWVDVRDVASGAMLAAERGRTGEGYLLSSEWVSVPDIAAMVQRITGTRAPRMTVPMWMARMTGPVVDLAAKAGLKPPYTSEYLGPLRASREMDTTKAREELGWTSMPIEQSLRDLFAWREVHA